LKTGAAVRFFVLATFVAFASLVPAAVSAAPQFCGGTPAQIGMDLGAWPSPGKPHTSALTALAAIVTPNSEAPPVGWLALDDRAHPWIEFKDAHSALRTFYGANAVAVSNDAHFYAIKGIASLLPPGYQLEDCESATLPGSDSE
jgi:hypothetical protein